VIVWNRFAHCVSIVRHDRKSIEQNSTRYVSQGFDWSPYNVRRFAAAQTRSNDVTSKITNLAAVREKTSILFHPKKEVTLDQVLDAVKRMVAEKGCQACGLNGFDLHFGLDAVINPSINERFAGLEISRVINEVAGLAPQIVTFQR
jgi:hypothetical protein